MLKKISVFFHTPPTPRLMKNRAPLHILMLNTTTFIQGFIKEDLPTRRRPPFFPR